ncbi:MAG: hypothetical protein PHQ41_03255, partial [Candidatus Cloacimonetes bacterium]|nr:hypothetical protein [Candidatus Cloacimonadota bacterium]
SFSDIFSSIKVFFSLSQAKSYNSSLCQGILFPASPDLSSEARYAFSLIFSNCIKFFSNRRFWWSAISRFFQNDITIFSKLISRFFQMDFLIVISGTSYEF